MKFPVFAFGLVIAAGVVTAQTAPVSAPAPTSPPATTAPAPAAKPADKADPKKKGEVKKKEEMGTIEGITLNRPNGEYLGLKLVDGKFLLTFYNKKKKPTGVDVTRANARWPNLHGPGDNRTVLNPSGANSLMGGLFVRGPYTFVLYLTLLRGEGDQAQAVENYTVQFHN